MTKAEKTRQFIIEKSGPIFNTKGIAATSMSDIMEATKLAKGSLYVHFENKEELSYAAVDHCLSILADKVLSCVYRETTAKKRLFAYLDVLSSPLNPPVVGGCPMINFGMEADDTSEVIRIKSNQLVEATEKRLSSIIAQGIKDGEFKDNWNPDEFAIKMFAMVEGGVMVSRIAGNDRKMKIIVKLLKEEIETHE